MTSNCLLITLLIFIVGDNIVKVTGVNLPKCCTESEFLKVDNVTSFNCVPYFKKRVGILTHETNFLEINENINGKCLDFNDKGDFFTFDFSNGTILTRVPTGEDFFPKCCPVNFSYNSTTHSCTSNSNSSNFIEKTFVRVGLPQCKLITDHKLTNFATSDLNSFDGIFCIDFDLISNGFVKRECKKSLDVCKDVRCVKKCCPDGQSFVGGANCIDTHIYGIDMTFTSNIIEPEVPFAVISNRTCRRIILFNETRFNFKLDQNGTFQYWKNISNGFVYEPVTHPKSYCIEHSNKVGASGFFFFICYPEMKVEDKFQITFVPKILSCVFLALTIAIYLILNETKNIFGKILINYCVGTLLLFVLLAYAQVYLKPSGVNCKLTGYSLIFLSTVSFAWLNVMCCDIWFTFGYTKQSVGVHQKRKDIKKLLFYLLYGYGMPILLTLLIYAFSTSEVLPYSIHPFVGISSCFIEKRRNNYAAILFLRLPHLIIQIINVVLFVKTITYCLKIRNEINRINDNTGGDTKTKFDRDKERLYLILKLSVIMGVTYLFEVLSSLVNMSAMGTVPKYIEIIWDCINCLQGVFIFIIFICKKKIYNNMVRKITGSRRITNTQSTITSSTRMSMLNSIPKKRS